MGTSGTKVLLQNRRRFMLDWLWLFLPLAYFHGWLTGRTHGVKLGAAGMFDQMFDKGKFKNGDPKIRVVELSLEDLDEQ